MGWREAYDRDIRTVSKAKIAVRWVLCLALILGAICCCVKLFKEEGVCLHNGYERLIYYWGKPHCLGVNGEPILIPLVEIDP